MKWLVRLIAALLVVTVTLGVSAWVLDSTVLNSTFLNMEATSTNTYSKVSTAVVNQLATSSNSNNAQTLSQIKQIITPQLIQQTTTSVISQIQKYYKSNGPNPSINLVSVVNQARSEGLQIPANNQLDKPIVIPVNDHARSLVQSFENVKTIMIIVSVVLLALLVFLSWERHKYLVLPDLAIMVGILIGVMGVIYILVPTAIDKFAHVNTASNNFIPIVQDFVSEVLRSIGKEFATIGGTLFVVGIVSRVVLGKLFPKVKAKSNALSPTTATSSKK